MCDSHAVLQKPDVTADYPVFPFVHQPFKKEQMTPADFSSLAAVYLFLALGTDYLCVLPYEVPSCILPKRSSQGGNIYHPSVCLYAGIHRLAGVTPPAACARPGWPFMGRRKKPTGEGLRCPARLWQVLGAGSGLSSSHLAMPWWARGGRCLGLCMAPWGLPHPTSFQSYSGGGKVPAQTSIASQDSPQPIVEKHLLQKVQLHFMTQQALSKCTFIYQQWSHSGFAGYTLFTSDMQNSYSSGRKCVGRNINWFPGSESPAKLPLFSISGLLQVDAKSLKVP